MIQVNWAQLSLLREGVKKWKAQSYRQRISPRHNASSTFPICPKRHVEMLQRQLMKAPPLAHLFSEPSRQIGSLLENERLAVLQHAIWSTPATGFVEHLIRVKIGKPIVIAVDLIDSCFSHQTTWVDTRDGVTDGRPTFIAILNFTTYIGKFNLSKFKMH